jgi:hypothetical protein
MGGAINTQNNDGDTPLFGPLRTKGVKNGKISGFDLAC